MSSGLGCRIGLELWGQVNAATIIWEGKPAVLSCIRDVTVQKKLEARLQQAQKMEAIGTLAGGIAHDFNNLLMSIQGNASLMLSEIDYSHPHYERLRNIENNFKRTYQRKKILNSSQNSFITIRGASITRY